VRSPSSIVRHCLVLAGLAAAAVAAVPEAGAQGAAPCPPGGPTPTVRAQDRQAGAGGTLTATHSIDIQTDFPDGSSPDVQVSAPAGVHVKGSALISDTPGPLPITLSWAQLQSDGTECTASTTTTLQLQAPTPLTFAKLPRSLRPKLVRFHGKYYSGGWTLTAPIGRYTDIRPLELRFRGIARARLPSASMPFKTVTAALRDLEPGIDSQRYLRGPKWQITSRLNYPRTAVFLEAGVKTGSARDHPVGYEFQALQAGRLMIRVRAAGKCNFGGCTWRTFKVQLGT
jgi:hypothetical protein